jgi:hypothetical protein
VARGEILGRLVGGEARRRADGLLEAVSATTAAQLRDRTRSAA